MESFFFWRPSLFSTVVSGFEPPTRAPSPLSQEPPISLPAPRELSFSRCSSPRFLYAGEAKTWLKVRRVLPSPFPGDSFPLGAKLLGITTALGFILFSRKPHLFIVPIVSWVVEFGLEEAQRGCARAVYFLAVALCVFLPRLSNALEG